MSDSDLARKLAKAYFFDEACAAQGKADKEMRQYFLRQMTLCNEPEVRYLPQLEKQDES